MTICVLYHDGFTQHEIGVTLNQLKSQNIITVALENRPYMSDGKQRVLPDKVLKEIDPEEVDLFIIPGGKDSFDQITNSSELKNFILKLNEKKTYIAGICYGADVVEFFGITREKDEENLDSQYSKLYQILVDDNDINIVRRENIIIAGGGAYVEFAMELAKLMKVYKNDEEAMREYKRLKNPKFIYAVNNQFSLLCK